MELTKDQFIKDFCIKLENKIVFPIYEYEVFDSEKMCYNGLTIKKSAEQVYQEELENKDKAPIEQKTKLELVQEQLTQLIINQL